MASTVAVIDYGMGNLHSVASALEHVGAERVLVTHDATKLRQADRVIFPGVGAIRDCMAEIRRLRCDELLHDVLETRHIPVLGICVGMQSLLAHSEENGGVDCLNILPGQVRGFSQALGDNPQRLKIPHMGWNQVSQVSSHPLWSGIEDGARFYFVHSFFVETEVPALVTGMAEYGLPFAAAMARDNLFAVQFHPEKSAPAGLTLLRNFLDWHGEA
ncbi:MAG: imidazole glycerol phosphate synthase subunit HisH [Pseudomonadota bacterium]